MPISAKMVTRCLAKAKTLFCFGVFPRLCFNAVFDLNAVIKQKKHHHSPGMHFSELRESKVVFFSPVKLKYAGWSLVAVLVALER